MIKRFRFGPSQLDSLSARAFRVTNNTPLDERTSQYAYTTEWFADRVDASLGQTDEAHVIVAEEVIQRGSDWLASRWNTGGRRWKHVSLARRAAGLTQAEFSERWRNHAGRATTKNAAFAPIPAAARGLAYVQNHPLIGVEWPFDAITEVWFDNRESMQARIDWFRDNVTTDELFGETHFLLVAEDVLSNKG
jgi:hypothetical protein